MSWGLQRCRSMGSSSVLSQCRVRQLLVLLVLLSASVVCEGRRTGGRTSGRTVRSDKPVWLILLYILGGIVGAILFVGAIIGVVICCHRMRAGDSTDSPEYQDMEVQETK
eukprot:NODE_5940_length_623_cov_35.336237_g5539_i0.p1 GENE.NODE_5940_length_623_cov_35.336237_g5539_i0~~NODE_5940_length_623_cov_35.336237_g5539_i0.p1  ORF type:complete len:110 (-),score=10.64 NODE_5940_length_623_cov_35.336237_g5539_i0:216-545(-)